MPGRIKAAGAGRAGKKRISRPPSPGVNVANAYERIWDAIVDHRLRPGTRLVEDRLCETFGLGRTRIRQVLQRLAHEQVVTLMPHRGAVVAKPSVQEANDVFEARRVLEAAMVEKFIHTATRTDKRRIREHVAREKTAWRNNERRHLIKLSGEFHLIVGEIAGNAVMLSLLRELVSRSSLIIAVYQASDTSPCPPDEHEELCAALEQGSASAIRLMEQHLRHVRAELNLVEQTEQQSEIELLLKGSVV
jgi:DNA-binding GntR family transcriptional regulator